MVVSRKRFARRAVTVVCALSLIALNVESVSAATGSASISGVITSKATGLGIGGVCVAAVDPSQNSGGEMVTLSDGTFDFENLPAGSYNFSADTTCDGRQQSIYIGQFDPTPYTVSNGTQIVNANLELVVGATMSGTVTSAATNAGVGLWCLDLLPDNEYNPGYYETTTASSGSYSFTGLPVGKYPVEIWASPTCDAGTSLEYAPQSWNVTVPSFASAVHRNFKLSADSMGITFSPNSSVLRTGARSVLTKFLAAYVPGMLLYMTITGNGQDNARLARSRAIATSDFLSHKVHLRAQIKIDTDTAANVVTMTNIQFTK